MITFSRGRGTQIRFCGEIVVRSASRPQSPLGNMTSNSPSGTQLIILHCYVGIGVCIAYEDAHRIANTVMSETRSSCLHSRVVERNSPHSPVADLSNCPANLF